jgi:GNAT superfamily N-acetyltransferase
MTQPNRPSTPALALFIRRATLEDAPAISGVITSLSHHFMSHPDGEEAESVLRSIEPAGIAVFLESPYFRHWVACDQDQVIAVAGLRDNAHLYHLFVAREWQGCGVGRTLWQHVMAAALTPGNPTTRFTVNSTVHGQPFYERVGFTVTGPLTQRDGMVYTPMVMLLPC